MTLRHYIRRFIVLLLVIWTAATLNFFVPKLAPKNPIQDKLAEEMEQGGGIIDVEAVAAEYEAKFGLDKPLLEQYGTYFVDMLTFDFGYSIAFYPRRVSDMILDALPWTIGLLLSATLISFVIGTLLGALTVWPGAPRWIKGAVPVVMIFSAIPYYLIGLVIVYLFAYLWRVFPLGGGYNFTSIPAWNFEFAIEILYHAFLPAMSMIVAAAGTWALSMRGMMVNVQGEDYMTFAEARGLAPRRRFLRYGIRNAMLPQVTSLALSLGHVASGAVLVELVFGYPGLGQLLYKAIDRSDYFVIYGVVFVVILIIAIAMMVVDLIYPLLDPRVRHGRG